MEINEYLEQEQEHFVDTDLSEAEIDALLKHTAHKVQDRSHQRTPRTVEIPKKKGA
jgi:uncharacterized protein YdaT